VVAIGIPAVVLLLVGMLVLSLMTGGTTSRKPSGHPRPASGRRWRRGRLRTVSGIRCEAR
jgi:hypothetical protein